jgi:hypothetical protein
VITVQLNEAEFDREYLAAIKSCFGSWGDENTFNWVFRRKLSFPASDMMVLRSADGELLAGSGVTHRRLALANGNTIGIGIMTGSWTLPAARRQGCFGRISAESLSLTRERGGALLVAFVTEDNASARRLKAAGAALVPAHYVFTTVETSRPRNAVAIHTVPLMAQTGARMHEITANAGRNSVHFVYPTFDDFMSQIVKRPDPSEIVGDAVGNMCAIEQVNDTDRIQLMACPANDDRSAETFLAALLARALDRGRRMFLYTTNPTVFSVTQRLGLGHKPGFITLLVADEGRLREAAGVTAEWSGDCSTALADPESDWRLGPWEIQSGDRS